MANAHESVDGSYEKSIEDSGDGQASKKFSNPISKPKMSKAEPQQSITEPEEGSSKAHSIP